VSLAEADDWLFICASHKNSSAGKIKPIAPRLPSMVPPIVRGIFAGIFFREAERLRIIFVCDAHKCFRSIRDGEFFPAEWKMVAAFRCNATTGANILELLKTSRHVGGVMCNWQAGKPRRVPARRFEI
jgi:hypothetical protein